MLRDAVDRTASPRGGGKTAHTKKPASDTATDSAAATQAAALTATPPPDQISADQPPGQISTNQSPGQISADQSPGQISTDQPPDRTLPADTMMDTLAWPLTGSPPPQTETAAPDTALLNRQTSTIDLLPEAPQQYSGGLTAEEYAAYVAARDSDAATKTAIAQETAPPKTPAIPPAENPDTATEPLVMREVDILTTTLTLPDSAPAATTPAQEQPAPPPQNSPIIPAVAEDRSIVHVQSEALPAAEIAEDSPVEAEKPVNRILRFTPEPEKADNTLGDRFSQAARQLSDLRSHKGNESLTATSGEAKTATQSTPATKAATTAQLPVEAQTKGVETLTQTEQTPHRDTQKQSGKEEETIEAAPAEGTAPSAPRANFPEAVGQIFEKQAAAKATPAEQIETELLKNLENQKMEFRMQLQPAELGKVDIRMVLESGKLVVEILSTAKTNDLLSRQADSLAATLRLSSPELSSVQVVTETASSGTAYLENALTGGDAYAGQQDNRQPAHTNLSSRQQHETGEPDSPTQSIREIGGARALDYTI
jgi:hypothetical protein